MTPPILRLAAMTLSLAWPATALAKPTPAAPSPTKSSAIDTGAISKATVAVGKVPKQNRAYLLAHGGSIDTEIALDDFVHDDHTVSVWTMLQYPHGDFGPVLAENGSGVYLIGQADYRKGNYDKAAGKAGDPVMFVQVGSTRSYYLVPEADGGHWVNLTVVRRSGTFEVYINGSRRSAYSKSAGASDVSVPTNYTNKPHGTLRLGRRTTGSGKSNQWQTYGYIDELGIFRRALSATEVASLASSHRLTGKEAGLWKGISFDEPEGSTPLPTVLATPFTATTRAKQFKVSRSRRSSDRATWDLPFYLMAMYPDSVQLPFAKNEVWRVTQGMDDPKISHNGYAVFTLDFSRVSADGGCALAPVVAIAPGRVLRYRDDHNPPDGDREGNKIHLQTSLELGFTYLHLEYKGLASAITGGGTKNPDNEMMEYALGTEPIVQAGDDLGDIGADACHLHFGAWKPGGGGLIPYPFADFEVSTDGGTTWKPVLRGIPRKGMLVRRTKDIDFPNGVFSWPISKGVAIEKGPAIKRTPTLRKGAATKRAIRKLP